MIALAGVTGRRTGEWGVWYHLRLWLLAVRVTVWGRVTDVCDSARLAGMDHVVLIVAYGSGVVIHSNELMTVAYTWVTVLHYRHAQHVKHAKDE